MDAGTSAEVTEWLAAMRAALDGIAEVLRARFPAVRIVVEDATLGSLTAYQARHTYLEAILAGGDAIALEITAAYLTTTPRVSADVTWNADAGGAGEASTFEHWSSSTEWPPATAENRRRIQDDLPRLVEALASALDRRARTPSA